MKLLDHYEDEINNFRRNNNLNNFAYYILYFIRVVKVLNKITQVA